MICLIAGVAAIELVDDASVFDHMMKIIIECVDMCSKGLPLQIVVLCLGWAAMHLSSKKKL